MRSLIYKPICDARGNLLDWINELRNLSGAYVFRDKRTKQILYVGDSATGNLAKTIKRHLYPWRDDPVRKHHVYDRHGVELAVRLTPPTTAIAAQDNLIRRLKPRDNGYVPVQNPF